MNAVHLEIREEREQHKVDREIFSAKKTSSKQTKKAYRACLIIQLKS